MMVKLRRSKGQSILEYLVIIVLIIGALVLVRPAIALHLIALFNGARDRIGDAQTAVNTALPAD